VYHIYEAGRPTNFKIGTPMDAINCHGQLGIKAYEVEELLARGRGNTVSAEPGGHTTCYLYICNMPMTLLLHLILLQIFSV